METKEMEELYKYLIGPEFVPKVEAILRTFVSMEQQLQKEKRSMNSLWKARQKQIERLIDSTVGLYGDMKGIIGSKMPEIEDLNIDMLESKPKQKTLVD